MSQPIPPNIVTLTPPRVITVTFTEEDRQKAGGFCQSESCILATALKRMGYVDVVEQVLYTMIGQARYRHVRWSVEACSVGFSLGKPGEGPFYAPEVVGKTIVLTRQ